jgi:hypothetical protein
MLVERIQASRVGLLVDPAFPNECVAQESVGPCESLAQRINKNPGIAPYVLG